MSTALVKPLADTSATDAAFSGGKGANLAALTAAGFPVPEGFVIGVPAYREAVTTDRPALSDAVRDAIVAAYHAMGREVAVAVRSSAVAEDGATASHAGIYETVLNVTGVTEVLEAVAHCWASASSSRARRYHDARGSHPDDGGIAVVVQRQIFSTCAGVAFTGDPLTGSTARVILESAPGFGQAVVDGLVTPDRVVIDKRTLAIVAIEHGVLNRLSEKRIRELAECACRVEQWYGSPQDIEWAFDEHGQRWVLQTRPITGLDTLAARSRAMRFYDPPRPAGSRWSRVNISEALPGVPTPLTWSLWGRALTNAQRRSQIQLGAISKRVDQDYPALSIALGWPVLSVDLLLRQMAQIPGADPNAFSEQFFGAAEHVDAAPVWARTKTMARMATRAPSALALLNRRIQAASLTSWRAWQRDAWRPPVDPMALLIEAVARFEDTLTVHTTQTVWCQSLYQAVERAAGGQTISVLSGDGDLPEAHLARDLGLLARGRITLERFLSQHGFHGPDEGEVAAASWRQDPEPVLHAARSWAGCDPGCDPQAGVRRRRDERHQAQAELCASVPRLRRRMVAGLIGMARTALVGREIGKAAFLQDLDVVRHAVSCLGENALWHTLEELQGDVLLPPIDIVARQRIRAEYAAQEPPLSFVGDPEMPPPGAGEDVRPQIAGIGASPGRARGRARVVTDPAARVDLGADDILIARTTDPSWVIMFIAVAGMAIDVGGTLSHAAIIARELGVPCVIGTGNGTRLIPDGALVEIDGSQGTVRILEADPMKHS